MAPSADDVVKRLDSQSLGQLIARRRRQLGLSQRDLADLLCAVFERPTVTRHALSRYERGVRLPRRRALEALASCPDVPLWELQQAGADRLPQADTADRQHGDGM